MKQLRKIRGTEFEVVWNMMQDSFPPDERRTREGQQKLLQKPEYELLVYEDGGNIVAFLALWHLDGFAFLEHFAVEKTARNGGIGAEILSILFAQEEKLVLEVELPEDERKKRRISFYERNGMCYNDYAYWQPAMTAETQPVPLRIMSAPGYLSEKEFFHVRGTLYDTVYHL